MAGNELDIWTVETGDKFTRTKGMPDVWEVVDIDETPGFGTPVREVTLAAAEYDGPASDVTLRTNADENCPQFEREFEADDE